MTSGDSALRKYEVGKYSVILTDFKMDGMTGIELAERIKSQDAVQPIILISGFPPSPPSAAVDMVILKPFSAVELRNAVAMFCNRGSDDA